ncbi:MAG: ribosome maturation factor RimM [Actinomycetota bacterium]
MVGAPSGSLEIGRLGRPHGLRGEMMVTLTTDRRERLAAGSRWWVAGRELTVVAARPHQGRDLVRLSGIDDRDAAAALTGERVYAEPLATGDTLDAGVVWVHEVIGAEVVDRAGVRHGTVVSVEANPAHDLLVLDSGALVPMVFVVEHDEGRVLVDPPPGLLD